MWALDNNINDDEHKFIKKIRKEISIISDEILINNPKLQKIAIKEEKTNVKGSVMSNFLMVYESLILETVYYYCVKNGYIINNNCSLAFDGLLIEKNKYKTELLDELQNEVINKLGLTIKFKQKEMNEGFNDDQLEREQKDPLKSSKFNWDLSEAEFAKALKRICFDDKPVLFTGKGREPDGFLYNGVFWNPLSLHNAELQQLHFDKLYNYYIKELGEIEADLDEKYYKQLLGIVKTLNTHKTRSNIIKIFKADNYVENVEWNKNIYLFVFDDSIYDLHKGEFVTPDPNN